MRCKKKKKKKKKRKEKKKSTLFAWLINEMGKQKFVKHICIEKYLESISLIA